MNDNTKVFPCLCCVILGVCLLFFASARPYTRYWRDCISYFFFFFQAEDGIRDIGVTGVQTCALPISVTWANVFFVLHHIDSYIPIKTFAHVTVQLAAAAANINECPSADVAGEEATRDHFINGALAAAKAHPGARFNVRHNCACHQNSLQPKKALLPSLAAAFAEHTNAPRERGHPSPSGDELLAKELVLVMLQRALLDCPAAPEFRTNHQQFPSRHPLP